MGKIFGISNLPVTIFTTPLESVNIKKPKTDWRLIRPYTKDSFCRECKAVKNLYPKFMKGIKK